MQKSVKGKRRKCERKRRKCEREEKEVIVWGRIGMGKSGMN